MAQMGILTQGSLTAMGEAVKATFDRIVDKTGNMTAALKASWPELVKLYNWFTQLGMDVPPWLDELISKGQEMGLSMEDCVELYRQTERRLRRHWEKVEAVATALRRRGCLDWDRILGIVEPGWNVPLKKRGRNGRRNREDARRLEMEKGRPRAVAAVSQEP